MEKIRIAYLICVVIVLSLLPLGSMVLGIATLLAPVHYPVWLVALWVALEVILFVALLVNVIVYVLIMAKADSGMEPFAVILVVASLFTFGGLGSSLVDKAFGVVSISEFVAICVFAAIDVMISHHDTFGAED